MRRKTIMKRIQAMPLERKVLAISAIVTLASCFMPWYGINSRVINEWWNAFGSIGSVAGYIVFAFSLLSLAMVAVPALIESEIQKKMPVKETALHVFLQGQSFFVALLFIPVYSQYSLINATNSGTRFGLYVALISTFVGTLVAMSQHRKREQLGARANFASVPSPQRTLHEWEEEESSYDTEETEEAELQEEMFTEEQPVAAETSSYYAPETSHEGDQEEVPFNPYKRDNY